MPLTPDAIDKLEALWRRFDFHPEASFVEGGGAVLKRDAYVAFLDARKLIERVRQDLSAELRGWQPIDRYFDQEQETATVLLWAELAETGEFGVTMGYYDPDRQCWYREREGPDLESEAIEPTKFMAMNELMRAASDEFVRVPRLEE